MKLALGLGCDRNTPLATLETAVGEALMQCGADVADVAAVASITLKSDEPALLQLANKFGWSIRFHTAAELATIDVPNPSETVRRHTGTPSVSEAAALLAACPHAPDMKQLLVEKHRLRGLDGRNATVSIARITA